jgi:hypothetical protein
MNTKILKRTDADVLRILERYRKDYNIKSEIVNDLITRLSNASEAKERKTRTETLV